MRAVFHRVPRLKLNCCGRNTANFDSRFIGIEGDATFAP
jgi:hypothetical protein